MTWSDAGGASCTSLKLPDFTSSVWPESSTKRSPSTLTALRYSPYSRECSAYQVSSAGTAATTIRPIRLRPQSRGRAMPDHIHVTVILATARRRPWTCSYVALWALVILLCLVIF